MKSVSLAENCPMSVYSMLLQFVNRVVFEFQFLLSYSRTFAGEKIDRNVTFFARKL